MTDKFEIRDAKGRVIGAASGDAEWVRGVMAEWAERGLVEEGSRTTLPLRVIEGGKGAEATGGDDD